MHRFALLLGATLALSGCSAHPLIDNMPASVGGLPEGTPARPATAAAYPAVHDMPPARSDAPLTEAEKKRLQDELVATRERNARRVVPVTTGSTQPSGGAQIP